MLSFEEKIMALATIRALGLSKAVFVVARLKRAPIVTVREQLDKLDGTHYLLDDGFVEKSHTGVVQYVDFACPQQPQVVTKEYFDNSRAKMQEQLAEALAVLNCEQVIGRPHKPLPIKRKVRNATTEETQPTQ